jgi:hypothetical protein
MESLYLTGGSRWVGMCFQKKVHDEQNIDRYVVGCCQCEQSVDRAWHSARLLNELATSLDN